MANEFLPFAIDPGAHVLSQAEYVADAARGVGIEKGILLAARTNKTFRQSTFVASGTAQMVETILGEDVLDDGNMLRFVGQLIRAIQDIASVGIAVGANPPNRAEQGTLWWDTDGGQLYVYFDDGNSLQWVIANHGNTGVGSSAGLDYLPTTGGYMTGPIILAGLPTQPNEAASKEYVDAQTTTAVIDGGQY